MIRWDSIEDIINIEFFQILAFKLLQTENTCENTIKCFNSLFLSRSDSEIAFSLFSPFLIDSLSKGTFESQMPVTLNFQVIEFLINFLGRYWQTLNLAIFYNDRKIERFTNETVKILSKTMQDAEFSFSTLHEDLIHLYEVILSIPYESIVDGFKRLFWHFWDEILINVRFEKESQESVVKPSLSFFAPFFAEIRFSLFNSLPCVFFDSDLRAAESVFSSIFSIDKSGYMNFLIEQPPSPQLCLSIAALEKSSFDELQKVKPLIEELMLHVSDGDFRTGLLYGLSHIMNFFKGNSQLFSQFIEFIFNSISSSEFCVSNEASLAFQRIVSNHSELFVNDIQFYIEFIIGHSEVFLFQLAPKVSKRIFKGCTRLAICADEKVVKNIVCQLFEPVIAVINEYEKHGKTILEASLDIVSKSFNFLGTFSSDLFDFFWGPLMKLAAALFPCMETPIEIIEKIIFAAVNIQLNFVYDQISSQIFELFEIMKKRTKIEDSFFMYFSCLRSVYEEVDSIFNVLFNELVIPYLKSEETAPTELFFMVAEFSPTVVDFEWFSQIVIQSLRTLPFNICEAALAAFGSVLERFSVEKKIDFLYHMSAGIVASFVEFLTDLLHKPLFAVLTDVLWQIFFLIDFECNDDYALKKLPDLFKEVIVSSLKKFANEPQQNFFENFADFLLTLRESKDEFRSAFTKLLFAIKKVTPCDFDFFTNGQILRSKNNLKKNARSEINK